MHLYQNRVVEWFVAESLEDAKDVAILYFKNVGYSEDEYDLDLKQTPDDKVITLLHDPYGEDEKETLTAKEFATKYGRGFLMSTEY